ncbi:LysR family transcriptional regulator [Limnoglobus roseus]|uniref:LysR family transcriptional regulator n=1 Tax=Limnoglobus roseus TaxID=2598579 RepID=A0A5C1AMQ7_9BACT|nr:LysR family transcriptional regulator [Limnoglobus roseus]QEL20270.1 LysR family transcriptional regulator [Limnoglobus roseus]
MNQLRYFAALARLGNFTRAAAACHVSQPTLSQQVAKLERELDQSLFDRRGRGATLTDAGRALLEKVEHALALLDNAKVSVRSAGHAERLTVAAIPTIAPYLLPEVLVRFATAHPAAHVEVREYTTDECLAHLTNGELDLAVLALPVRGDHLAAETLFTEELLLAVPAKHALAKKRQVRLTDLTDEPFVLLHEAHCLSGQALGFCARHALAPLVTAQLHQLGTVLELVRLGQGVSLVPAMAAKKDRSGGRVYKPIFGEKPMRTLGVVWSKLRFRSPLFDAFVGELRKSSKT